MNNQDFKQEFESRIEQRWGRHRRHSERSRIGVGLLLLAVGALFLLKISGVILFPGWFFTWPMLLIGFGLLSGFRNGFRHMGWLFPVAIGGIFLADSLSPDFNLRPYFWPILLIAAGLFIILRPRRRRCGPFDDEFNDPSGNRTREPLASVEGNPGHSGANWKSGSTDRNDVIDATAVFGGVKKNILSKNFRGGDITTFMGGAEINLSQADFTGRATIDCFNMFGGTKLIVPPDWEVQSDVVAIFGGVDDKRPPSANGAPTKVLYLDGTCLFGGLEIKSY